MTEIPAAVESHSVVSKIAVGAQSTDTKSVDRGMAISCMVVDGICYLEYAE